KGRVPGSLAVFLTALAIFDDLGAIIVIALFYGGGVQFAPLLGASLLTGFLVLLNLYGVRNVWVYALLGFGLWLLVLLSGIHATIAGVILGLCIPARPERSPEELLAELDQAVTDIRSGSSGDQPASLAG